MTVSERCGYKVFLMFTYVIFKDLSQGALIRRL